MKIIPNGGPGSNNATLNLLSGFSSVWMKSMNRLRAGSIDAPDFSNAISLGYENDQHAKIYKINVPGYFYRCQTEKLKTWRSTGKTGIYVAADPNALVNKETLPDQRMLYHVGTDTFDNDSGNNLYPILPGSSTYAYFVRDTTITGDELKEFWFVPTIAATSLMIDPTDFVTPVGECEDNLGVADDLVSDTDTLDLELVKTIFGGEWYSSDNVEHNWRAMLSRWRIKDDNVIFLQDFEAKFKQKRIEQIKTYSCDPSIYGY